MRSRVALVVVAGLALVPAAGLAQHARDVPAPVARIGACYVGLGVMEAWGESAFQISGRDQDIGRFTSRLEFPMDAPYLVLEGGVEEIGKGFGVHLRYGATGKIEGTTTDTDYAWDISAREFIKSVSSTDGENVFLTLDLSYRLFGRARDGGRGRLDVFGGYQLQDATLEISGVHTVIENWVTVDYFHPGLAATYDMEFRGVRVGLRGEWPLGGSSTISGYVAVLPYVRADGFGQWILRRKVVDHDADGWGLDLLVRFDWALARNVSVWGGVGYARMDTGGGVDAQYLFSGEPLGTSRLDDLESEYTFITIGAAVRF